MSEMNTQTELLSIANRLRELFPESDHVGCIATDAGIEVNCHHVASGDIGEAILRRIGAVKVRREANEIEGLRYCVVEGMFPGSKIKVYCYCYCETK